MRSAGNFHPEWGYLAPAPSFLRTVRIALVATAIGAIGGAVVVVSLVERPGADDDNTSIAAHALVTSAPVIASAAASPTAKAPASVAQAPMPAQAQPAVASMQPPAPVSEPPEGAAASANKPNAAPTVAPAPASVAALAETPPAVEAAPAVAHPKATVVPEVVPAKRAPIKKRRNANYDAARRWQATSNARKRWRDDRGFGPLLRLFSFRTDSLSSPN